MEEWAREDGNSSLSCSSSPPVAPSPRGEGERRFEDELRSLALARSLAPTRRVFEKSLVIGEACPSLYRPPEGGR